MKGQQFFVYIMSNPRRTVYYTGMTNSLERRYIEHVWKQHNISFTARYNVIDLLYFEEYTSSLDTIKREKQIKGWTRKRKIELIKTTNPEMKNLFTVTSSC